MVISCAPKFDIMLFSMPTDSRILLISLCEDAILHACSSSVDENIRIVLIEGK